LASLSFSVFLTIPRVPSSFSYSVQRYTTSAPDSFARSLTGQRQHAQDVQRQLPLRPDQVHSHSQGRSGTRRTGQDQQLQLLDLQHARYTRSPKFFRVSRLTRRCPGYLLVYPLRSDVVFANNSDSKLKDYYFGKKNKPHRFCPECSSTILIDFKDSDIEGQRAKLAMNVSILRMLRWQYRTIGR